MNSAGLDVHKDFVQACIVNKNGKTLLDERFETTPEGLQQLQKQMKNAHCVIESSTACYQVYDALQAAQIPVHAAHPLKVKAIAFAKIKTDKIDAHTLAQLERADLIPEAHLPDKETREQRVLVRQHVALTEESTRLKNRIRALFLKQGIKTPSDLFDSRKRIAEYPSKLSGATRMTVMQLFEQLRFLREQRAAIDKTIEEAAHQNEDAKLLRTMPGVGWFSAFLLASEIDGVKRFPDAQHLQSYGGLVPAIRQSGNTAHYGHISKQGNPLIRWVLVQDAWVAVEHSRKFRKFFLRVKRRHGAKRAVIAVARKMLGIAFVMLSRRQAFRENAC